jgi:hypothetical protein
MKENERLARSADVIDKLALGCGNRPGCKNSRGYFIRYHTARRALAVLQGKCHCSQKPHSDSKTYERASLPEW